MEKSLGCRTVQKIQYCWHTPLKSTPETYRGLCWQQGATESHNHMGPHLHSP